MMIYIVGFEGAYGFQIDKIFFDRQKAHQWANKRNAEDICYHYEVKKFGVEK